MDIFLHGIETLELTDGNPRYVATIDSAIMFLVGTAPNASDALFPYEHPQVIRGYNDMPLGLGDSGTLPLQLEYAIAQSGRASPTIYYTRVEEGASAAETMANVLGDRAAKTGMHSISRIQPEFGDRPKLLGAPGFTSTRPTDGVASLTLTDNGQDYTEAPTVAIVRGAGDTTGFGAAALAAVNSDGTITLVLTNPGQGYTETPTVAFSGGDGTGAAATATLGQVANPAAMELQALCGRYRACSMISGPNTTDEAAVTYRGDFDTGRMMLIDPFVKVEQGGAPVSIPADGLGLALQARLDYEKGFWHSPSNKVLQGVLGTHRGVEHSMSDRSAASQYLNKNHVSTIVRSPQGGWKFYGNRVMTADPLQVFWSVRRAHDVIIESVEIANEYYIDEPYSVQKLVDIAQTVNRALRRWQAFGATLGGEVWLDPTINTAESMSNGILYVDYDGEAPAPIERITFRFNRNTGYYDTMLQSAAREIARLSSLAA
ncbi:MAG: phage tail sheath subtilisin-like domain-containing protein [Devosia sp.]